LTATLAFPLSVKVQLLVFAPLLEQAPDHTAERPPAVSVILVPTANGAAPVLPTVTSMPAGFDVILVPVRPVAVTLKVADAPGGVTVSVAVTPPPA
jgi:hypothetical protein